MFQLQQKATGGCNRGRGTAAPKRRQPRKRMRVLRTVGMAPHQRRKGLHAKQADGARSRERRGTRSTRSGYCLFSQFSKSLLGKRCHCSGCWTSLELCRTDFQTRPIRRKFQYSTIRLLVRGWCQHLHFEFCSKYIFASVVFSYAWCRTTVCQLPMLA